MTTDNSKTDTMPKKTDKSEKQKSTEGDSAQAVHDRVAEEEKLIQEQLPDNKAGDGEEVTPDLIKKCYWRGETGLGELYAALHRGKFIHNNTTGEWLKYNDQHWELDELNEHIPAIEKVITLIWDEINILKKDKQELDPEEDKVAIKVADNTIKGFHKKINKLYDLKGQAACIKAARTVKNPLATTSDVFDNKPLLLVCSNGVVDLRTGKMKAGRPGDYLFNSTGHEFHGIVPTLEGRKIWDNILYTMFEDWEMANFLRRFFGYIAPGSTAEKVFAVASGGGSNGKRILIDSAMYVLGQYSITIKSELLLVQKNKSSPSGPTPQLCALNKIRLAVASEVNENAIFDAAEIKRLSGSDQLSVREPHAKRDTFQNQTHQLLIQVNDDPKCPGGDIGFWERMIKIQFPFTFVKNREPDPEVANERKADKDLFEKLVKIYPHILGCIVEGAVEYHEVGLEPPKSVLKAIQKYRDEEDIVGRWVKSDCEKSLQSETGATVLYKSFVEFYHETSGDKEPSQNWFGKQLKKKFTRFEKSGRFYYRGIKISDDPYPPGDS